MGLTDAFIENGHRARHFRVYAGNRTRLNLDMARTGSRYGFILNLAQSETERLLRTHIDDLGGTIEQRVELTGARQRDDVVEVRLRDAAGCETEMCATYVVGCDGADSRVRHELGLSFEGQPYPQDFLLADVALDGAGDDGAYHLFFRADGQNLICLPMGQHRWRVVMPNVGERGGRPATFEEVQQLVEQRAPRPITISDPGWLASFRCHLRSTTAYRRGRVLLAGDAAHIHTPAGGQGMNIYVIAFPPCTTAGGHQVAPGSSGSGTYGAQAPSGARSDGVRTWTS